MDLRFWLRGGKTREQLRLPEGCVGRTSVADTEIEGSPGDRKLEVALVCAGNILKERGWAYNTESKSLEAVDIQLDAAEIDFGFICEQCPNNPNRAAGVDDTASFSGAIMRPEQGD